MGTTESADCRTELFRGYLQEDQQVYSKGSDAVQLKRHSPCLLAPPGCAYLTAETRGRAVLARLHFEYIAADPACVARDTGSFCTLSDWRTEGFRGHFGDVDDKMKARWL